VLGIGALSHENTTRFVDGAGGSVDELRVGIVLGCVYVGMIGEGVADVGVSSGSAVGLDVEVGSLLAVAAAGIDESFPPNSSAPASTPPPSVSTPTMISVITARRVMAPPNDIGDCLTPSSIQPKVVITLP
jgi:hypothetical protein